MEHETSIDNKPDICDWLRGILKNGKKEVSQIRSAAKAAGYSKGELREAKLLCRVEVTNNWDSFRGNTTEWYWQLPREQL